MREVGLVGYGGVICGHSGCTALSFNGPFPNGSVIEVELYALWWGILELVSLEVPGSIVEGDYKVVEWVSGSTCPWIFLDKIEEIRHMISAYNFQITGIIG